jgi:hypothetical protein
MCKSVFHYFSRVGLFFSLDKTVCVRWAHTKADRRIWVVLEFDVVLFRDVNSELPFYGFLFFHS